MLDEAKRLLLISAPGDEQIKSSLDGRAHVIQCVKFRQNMTACVFAFV